MPENNDKAPSSVISAAIDFNIAISNDEGLTKERQPRPDANMSCWIEDRIWVGDQGTEQSFLVQSVPWLLADQLDQVTCTLSCRDLLNSLYPAFHFKYWPMLIA